ncbi:alpha/beta fold hydrolase [Streptomyces noboritoensis]|uniref:Alpha/beta fold hydrolase n=1 Tax=Streptomyces noboritoensis TaxID=67337 RepID=A0ABV6TSI3_9ACTN
MPTVKTSSAEVEYFVTGEGPGLVLLHGTGGAAEGFAHLVEKFSDKRTVITPNYSGSGRTKDNGEPLTVDAVVEQVAAAIRDAGTGPVDLVGWSLGALNSAALAAKHPELVRRLVLLTGWSALDERQRLFFDLWDRLDRLDHDAFGRFLQLHGWTDTQINAFGVAGVEGLLAGGIPAGIGRQIALNLQADITELLPQITVPTLVIGASQDRVVPVEHSRQLHQAIAGSRYAELDAGHFALFEKADELTVLLQEFLYEDVAAAAA